MAGQLDRPKWSLDRQGSLLLFYCSVSPFWAANFLIIQYSSLAVLYSLFYIKLELISDLRPYSNDSNNDIISYAQNFRHHHEITADLR